MFGRGVICSLLVAAGCNSHVSLGGSSGVAGQAGAAAGAGGQAEAGQGGGGQPGDGQAGGAPGDGGSGGGRRGQGAQTGGAGGGDPLVVQSGSWLPAANTNDAVTLAVTGAPLCGTGMTMRRKSIALTRAQADGGASDLVLGPAFLYTTVASEANLVATVTNTGTSMHCQIHTVPNRYRWMDSSGTAAAVINSVGIIGSEGDVGEMHLVSSCLAPGETGLIFDVQSPFAPKDVWAVTASIELALTYDSDGLPPAAVMAPRSFTYDGTNVSLHFQNQGTGPAGCPNAPAQFARYLLVDSGGQPLFFGALLESLDQPSTYVANVRDTGVGSNLDGRLLSEFLGCAVAVRAWVAFDKPPAVTSGAAVRSPRTSGWP